MVSLSSLVSAIRLEAVADQRINSPEWVMKFVITKRLPLEYAAQPSFAWTFVCAMSSCSALESTSLGMGVMSDNCCEDREGKEECPARRHDVLLHNGHEHRSQDVEEDQGHEPRSDRRSGALLL